MRARWMLRVRPPPYHLSGSQSSIKPWVPAAMVLQPILKSPVRNSPRCVCSSRSPACTAPPPAASRATISFLLLSWALRPNRSRGSVICLGFGVFVIAHQFVGSSARVHIKRNISTAGLLFSTAPSPSRFHRSARRNSVRALEQTLPTSHGSVLSGCVEFNASFVGAGGTSDEHTCSEKKRCSGVDYVSTLRQSAFLPRSTHYLRMTEARGGTGVSAMKDHECNANGW